MSSTEKSRRENRILSPEDYLEPQCVLCNQQTDAEPVVRPIPQMRVQEKLDDYMSRRDYAGAERHLRYWLEEARAVRDLRGELMVQSELVGHYRKTGNKDMALAAGEAALGLLDALGFQGTRSAATTYVNVATAMCAFGEHEKALPLFEQAKEIYETSERISPDLLGGLYNNMALALTALGRYGEAMDLYDRAMEQMASVPGGVLEQAITCLGHPDGPGRGGGGGARRPGPAGPGLGAAAGSRPGQRRLLCLRLREVRPRLFLLRLFPGGGGPGAGGKGDL